MLLRLVLLFKFLTKSQSLPASIVTAIREGRLGGRVAKAYAFLADHSFAISVALVGVYGGLEYAKAYVPSAAAYEGYLLQAIGVLVALGLFDSGVKVPSPAGTQPSKSSTPEVLGE